MPEDIEIEWKTLPREEAILLAMKIFNSSRSNAEFFVALARSETNGDCIKIPEITEPKELPGNSD